MQIKQKSVGDVLVIAPEGRIDSVNANDLETGLLAIVQGNNVRLVLNLAQVEFISSAGLRVLLIVAKKVKPLKGNMVLCGMNEDVAEVFDVSGFSNIFEIRDTEAEAMAFYSQA